MRLEQVLIVVGVAAAIFAVLLLCSCFGCCVLVWHARQHGPVAGASKERTATAMVLLAMFLHILSITMVLPVLTPLAVDHIFDGSTTDASVFLTGECCTSPLPHLITRF